MPLETVRAETVAYQAKCVRAGLRMAPPVVRGIEDPSAMHAQGGEVRRLRSGVLKLRDLSIQFAAFPEELGEDCLRIEASEHFGTRIPA